MSSDRAKHWAWKQADVSRSELLLLLAMADHVGETLLCYAEFKNLAAYARMSERTAQRTADRLVQMGKLERTLRPGRTTLFRLLVPPDFGKETGDWRQRRKASATHDKMTGVQDRRPENEQRRTPDTVSGVTPDKMAGVPPTTECRSPPSNWRGTHDKMSSDSSLNPSLHKPSQSAPARAGPGSGPGRADESQPHGDELVLKNRAMLCGITPQLPDEPRDKFLRRLQDGENRMVLDQAEQHRLSRQQTPEQSATEAA